MKSAIRSQIVFDVLVRRRSSKNSVLFLQSREFIRLYEFGGPFRREPFYGQTAILYGLVVLGAVVALRERQS